MLAEAARRSHGEPVLLAPDLAAFHVPSIAVTSPALREAKVHLIGWPPSDSNSAGKCQFAVIYHRRADLTDPRLMGGRVVKEYCIQGVWLARLIDLAPPSTARQVKLQ